MSKATQRKKRAKEAEKGPPPPPTRVCVVDDCREYMVQEPNPESSWDRGTTGQTHSISIPFLSVASRLRRT